MEMIVLLYRFSKVVGLTCKLDETGINCRSFPENFLEIFRTIFGTPVNNCFWTNRKRPFGGILKEKKKKKIVQNVLRKFWSSLFLAKLQDFNL